MSCDHAQFGLASFPDDQLQDELDFALLEREAGGCLGQRTRVANRIKALRAEIDLRACERILAQS